MEWQKYIEENLINSTIDNHRIENALQKVLIVPHVVIKNEETTKNPGETLASSSDFELSKKEVDIDNKKVMVDEFENLNDAFKNKGKTEKEGGIRLGLENFYFISYDENKKIMVLKKIKGGAIIAKTESVYIICVYSSDLKLRKDGTEIQQNPGYVLSILEEFLIFLRKLPSN